MTNPTEKRSEHRRLREALEPDALSIEGGLRGRAALGRALEARGHGSSSARKPGASESQAVNAVPVRLGLRENLSQFSLLVLVNAFVGAMVGMERSVLPALAEHEFRLTANATVLSFIVAFGITKACTNYLAGRLSDQL